MRHKSHLLTFWLVLVCSLLSPAMIWASEIAVIVGNRASLYENRFINGATQASIDLRIGIKLYQYVLSGGDDNFVKLLRDAALLSYLEMLRKPTQLELLLRHSRKRI
jgi:hypothetical protein